jgi:hypothetical protein
MTPQANLPAYRGEQPSFVSFAPGQFEIDLICIVRREELQRITAMPHAVTVGDSAKLWLSASPIE